MLNFTIKAGEYFTIGEEIKVVILGGSSNHCKVMVDAPRKYNIVRGSVLEKNALTPEDRAKLKKYYPEPAIPVEEMQRIMAKQNWERAARRPETMQPAKENGAGKARERKNSTGGAGLQ